MTAHAPRGLLESAPRTRGETPRVESVGCALCGSASGRERFREDPFAVRDCPDCGLTYVSPRIADEDLVREVYDARYWRSPEARTRGYTDYAADLPLQLATFRRRRRPIERMFGRPGRVLDVGCAGGAFLLAMRESGWTGIGLEPSASILDVARRRLGAASVVGCGIMEFDAGATSFDLVTLWDVIEHLPDPVAALSRARGWLAPGGKLVLETQNVASLVARLAGRRWHHYKHAEHLVHFTPGTLRAALERAGLRMLGHTTRHAGKHVRLDFLVERSARLGRWARALAAPLAAAGDRVVYVNPLDEMIVVAEAAR